MNALTRHKQFGGMTALVPDTQDSVLTEGTKDGAARPDPLLFRRFARLRPLTVALAAFLLLFAVGTIDRLSPPDFSVVLLYLVPLLVASWFGPTWAKWCMPLATVATWACMDSLEQPSRAAWLVGWLVLEKLVLFGGATFLFDYVRRSMMTQRALRLTVEQRLRMVEQLAAGVAHEVRNPLGTLLSGLEYFSRKEWKPVEQSLVDDMRSAVLRAEVIVRDLNDFSAPLRLDVRAVELHTLTSRAVKEVSAKARAMGIDVVVQCDTAEMLQADATRVIQVLVNLLRNALDVTPHGGVVRLVAHRDGAEICVRVEDEGPGIPPDKLETVFEPFFTTKAPGSGTGLGLAVSRRIATDHGGRLTLANRAERGLAATLTLPTKD